ncbi:MAG TPA: hypothetical protein VFY65_15420, partial [Longimicrobium sp.]|nr:hypothetical protein [Longimicrobium sp.]
KEFGADRRTLPAELWGWISGVEHASRERREGPSVARNLLCGFWLPVVRSLRMTVLLFVS